MGGAEGVVSRHPSPSSPAAEWAAQAWAGPSLAVPAHAAPLRYACRLLLLGFQRNVALFPICAYALICNALVFRQTPYLRPMFVSAAVLRAGASLSLRADLKPLAQVRGRLQQRPLTVRAAQKYSFSVLNNSANISQTFPEQLDCEICFKE